MKSMTKKNENRFELDTESRAAAITKGCAHIDDYIYLYDNLDTQDYLAKLYQVNKEYHTRTALFFIVLKGEMNLIINKNKVTLNKRDYICIPPFSTLCFTRVEHGTKYCAIRLTEKSFSQSFDELNLYNEKTPKIEFFDVKSLTDEQFNYTLDLYEDLKQALLSKHFNRKNFVARSTINLLHIQVINLYSIERTIERRTATSLQENLFREFINLLNVYAKTERSVKFYADKLEITPKYLSTISLIYSDKNASKWIESYVITIAKNLMHEKKYKVQEISEIMHFPSQSFFGRYFLRATGICPKRYMTTHL